MERNVGHCVEQRVVAQPETTSKCFTVKNDGVRKKIGPEWIRGQSTSLALLKTSVQIQISVYVLKWSELTVLAWSQMTAQNPTTLNLPFALFG